MKLISLVACLDYPCTINLSVLDENFKVIPEHFQKGNRYRKTYNTASEVLTDFVHYYICEVVLFEEISINRNYKIVVR